MTRTTEDTTFEQIVQKLEPHARLLRAWPLAGGVSARVTALEVERPGGETRTMIVRQHGAVDYRRNPNIAADEFKLLRLLRSAGVAAPAPYYVDLSCEMLPTPYVVIEYVEGTPEFAPWDVADLTLQLATHLLRVHAIDGSKHDLSFLPQLEAVAAERLRERPVTLDEALDEGRIRDALETAGRISRRNKSVLLHGDFWPGNILWRDGRLVAIVDWEDAAVGDPLADLANSRLEILWAFGVDAMHLFTQQYRALATIDLTNLPYWDLYAALRPASKMAGWGLDPASEQVMRAAHKQFTSQALERLSLASERDRSV